MISINSRVIYSDGHSNNYAPGSVVSHDADGDNIIKWDDIGISSAICDEFLKVIIGPNE